MLNETTTTTLATAAVSPVPQQQVLDEDWEEWDGQSPFWIHCVAGSLAGVTEHTAVYPLDTIRTNIQAIYSARFATTAAAKQQQQLLRSAAAAGTNSKKGLLKQPVVSWNMRGAGGTAASAAAEPQLPEGMWQTMRFLMNEPTAAAQAAKQATTRAQAAVASLSTTSASAASLSISSSSQQASVCSNQVKGMMRLWRGVETIILGCIPAHALHFSAYEIVKLSFTDPNTNQVSTFGNSCAGAAAAIGHDVIMTPVDTVKQRIQLGHYCNRLGPTLKMILADRSPETGGWRALYRSFSITLVTNIPYGMLMVSTNEACKQAFAAQNLDGRLTFSNIIISSSCAGFVASAVTTPLDRIKTTLQTQNLRPTCVKTAMTKSTTKAAPFLSWQHAAKHILATEGWVGFFRGITPRILSHTPAIAISWTTYETAKRFLLKQSYYYNNYNY